MKNVIKENQKIPYLFLLMLFSCLTISAQKGMTVRGTVFDSNGETIIGASVVLKGNNSIGTISDIVPLVDENRVIAKLGLKLVEVTKNIGLKTLLEVARVFKDRFYNSFIWIST